MPTVSPEQQRVLRLAIHYGMTHERIADHTGLPLGTVLAFMMATVAISLPEFLILRRVAKPALLSIFLVVVVSGILAVGYLFNALGM